ncbi:MAG: HRDC domain-containing protein, partial [Geobacteraceae bacterium]|nr:HRDC domain-containing protein [Geobacteraceae bacterium]
VVQGCSVPEDKLPLIARHVRPERDAEREDRLKRLKRWREGKALALGIDAGILVNNALLENLAKEVPRSMHDLDAFPVLRRWQKGELGEELLSMLH